MCICVGEQGSRYLDLRGTVAYTPKKNFRKGPFVSVVPINYSLPNKKAGKQAELLDANVQKMEMNYPNQGHSFTRRLLGKLLSNTGSRSQLYPAYCSLVIISWVSSA